MTLESYKLNIHACMYACMHVCMYVCMYVCTCYVCVVRREMQEMSTYYYGRQVMRDVNRLYQYYYF